MSPRALIFVAVVTAAGCFRVATPAAADNAPGFAINVFVEDDARTELRLLRVDGHVSPLTPQDEGVFAAKDWFRGPGQYTLALKQLREDGGIVNHTVPFELRANDVEVSGYVSFGHGDRPHVRLELIEAPPPGVRLEPASSISREGHASYWLTNETKQPLYSDVFPFTMERRSPTGWQHVAAAGCWGRVDHQLEPGSRSPVQSESLACLSEPLGGGEFRHVLRLRAAQDRELDAEVTRSIGLVREFGTSQIGAFSRGAFLDVPSAQLHIDSFASGSGGFMGTLVGPDGGTACVCPGSIVGKEQRRVTMGIGGLCLTADLDASVLICEEIEGGGRNLGDHPPFPFQREP